MSSVAASRQPLYKAETLFLGSQQRELNQFLANNRKNLPLNHKTYNLLGLIEIMEEKPERAIASFERALDLEPESQAYSHNLLYARWVSRIITPQDAQAQFAAISMKYPHSAVYHNLAKIMEQKGDEKVISMLDHMEQSRQKYPTYDRKEGLIVNFLPSQEVKLKAERQLIHHLGVLTSVKQVEFWNEFYQTNDFIKKVNHQLYKLTTPLFQALEKCFKAFYDILSPYLGTMQGEKISQYLAKELENTVKEISSLEKPENSTELLERFTDTMKAICDSMKVDQPQHQYEEPNGRKLVHLNPEYEEDKNKEQIVFEKNGPKYFKIFFDENENTKIEIDQIEDYFRMEYYYGIQADKLKEKNYFVNFYYSLLTVLKFYGLYAGKKVQYLIKGVETSLQKLNFPKYSCTVMSHAGRINPQLKDLSAICKLVNFTFLRYFRPDDKGFKATLEVIEKIFCPTRTLDFPHFLKTLHLFKTAPTTCQISIKEVIKEYSFYRYILNQGQTTDSQKSFRSWMRGEKDDGDNLSLHAKKLSKDITEESSWRIIEILVAILLTIRKAKGNSNNLLIFCISDVVEQDLRGKYMEEVQKRLQRQLQE